MRIQLSDGAVVDVSEAVMLQDAQWREPLRDYLAARSAAKAKHAAARAAKEGK